MLARLAHVPLLVVLMGATGLAMLVPSGVAFAAHDSPAGRAFLYSGLILMVLALFLALATGRPNRRPAVRGLFPLLGAIYLIVPAGMALPLVEILGLRFTDAWFEMISSFTTTGATLIDTPRRVPESVHLWRAMAGWAGGLFVLVSATALLAPIGLGGFELIRPAAEGGNTLARGEAARAGAGQQMLAHLRLVLPWYAGLSAALWLVLVLFGVGGLEALVLAMSTLSTSGIVMRETLGSVGFGAELFLFLFLLPALSRGLWPGQGEAVARATLRPELSVAAAVIGLVVLIVAARHWVGAFEVAEGENLPALGRAIWGTLFTALSFLTTTGFVSQDWIAIRAWSGLTPPGLVLLGLAILGGGVATTAGGVRLLRVYALARLGRAELERMIYPSMIVGGGERARFLAGYGGRAAWLFAMVFALAAAAVMVVLMLLGMSFETALVFTVAAITTTGPLVQVTGEMALHWSLLSDPAKAVLGLAMILGRLEFLVLLALLAAQFARD